MCQKLGFQGGADTRMTNCDATQVKFVGAGSCSGSKNDKPGQWVSSKQEEVY
jgi:hypothetical protein